MQCNLVYTMSSLLNDPTHIKVFLKCMSPLSRLTLKVPITTAADNTFKFIYLFFFLENKS